MKINEEQQQQQLGAPPPHGTLGTVTCWFVYTTRPASAATTNNNIGTMLHSHITSGSAELNAAHSSVMHCGRTLLIGAIRHVTAFALICVYDRVNRDGRARAFVTGSSKM